MGKQFAIDMETSEKDPLPHISLVQYEPLRDAMKSIKHLYLKKISCFFKNFQQVIHLDEKNLHIYLPIPL
jgi:hypothetical protein